MFLGNLVRINRIRAADVLRRTVINITFRLRASLKKLNLILTKLNHLKIIHFTQKKLIKSLNQITSNHRFVRSISRTKVLEIANEIQNN